MKRNLFDGWVNTFATLMVLGVLAWALPPIFRWSVVNAVFGADNAACRAAAEIGACWGVVAEKYRLILFGRYPYEEQWRPLVACALMIALIVASCWRPFWRAWLLVAWVVVMTAFFVLMLGGWFGLAPARDRLVLRIAVDLAFDGDLGPEKRESAPGGVPQEWAASTVRAFPQCV